MSDICAVCGKRIRLFRIKIKDAYICGICQDKLPLRYYSRKEEYDALEIREIIRQGEERDNAKPDMLQAAILKFKDMKSDGPDRFEQVREYRRLCDEGLITEEEYESKRKELLEL